MKSQDNLDAGSGEACVNQIHGEIIAAQGSRLWKDSINMLNTVSQSVFSRSAHFLLELLQNSEDACARAKKKGSIIFRISPERIQVAHNGSQFTPDDVSAICGVRSTKRPEEDSLGFLGIGFKSVFKVTDSPEIHSGNFHFKFDRNAHANPASVPWQILPIWNASDSLAQGSNTTFVLPFRQQEFYTQTLEELRKLDVHVFLFLRYVKTVVIIYEAEHKKTVIRNHGEQNRIIKLTKDGISTRFVIFRQSCKVPQDVVEDPALEFYKRKEVKQREVVLAFGVDPRGNLEPISEASTLGSVSSFLPLVEERSGAKFLIQGDFLVQPGREAIQYELAWNHWLISQAGELAKKAIDEFKKHPKWGGQFLPLFEFVNYVGQAPHEKLFKPVLHNTLNEYLKTAAVHRTRSGTFVTSTQAVYVEDALKKLVTDADLTLLFPGRSHLRIVGVTSAVRSLPEPIRTIITWLTLAQTARDLALLKSKAKGNNHLKWFTDFFIALKNSGQNFTHTQSRDWRGRITSVESPIYVLTEQNNVILANRVYLRDIPADVIVLGKKFAAVEKLLSSYELIHPALDTPPLVQFLKQQTHGRSIDFQRICRDVFLPRLVTTAIPPSSEELIAYTRLVQKGLEIYDRIWVLTKDGTLKPSNQVFFSCEYTPAEDWESNASFIPYIDFISADYLKSVPKAEIANWKAFFIRTGVHQDADNPYVRDFAMQYVHQKLGGELDQFVAKDHQQQGYDFDCRRKQDNLQVALEVKGQKKEAPVDLIGQEPIAAQQMKLSGGLFWLCVVVGIPEDPQLWVVEDPLGIGDHKTVTVDISKWKTHGRKFK